jgi:hypothetical protein
MKPRITFTDEAYGCARTKGESPSNSFTAQGLFATPGVMNRTEKVINEKFPPRFSYWFNKYSGDVR